MRPRRPRNTGLALSREKFVDKLKEDKVLVEAANVEKVYDIVEQLFQWVEREEGLVLFRAPASLVRKLFTTMGRDIPDFFLTPEEQGAKEVKHIMTELRDEEPKTTKNVIKGGSNYE